MALSEKTAARERILRTRLKNPSVEAGSQRKCLILCMLLLSRPVASKLQQASALSSCTRTLKLSYDFKDRMENPGRKAPDLMDYIYLSRLDNSLSNLSLRRSGMIDQKGTMLAANHDPEQPELGRGVLLGFLVAQSLSS
jgi:hypothetical protein